MTNQKEPKPKAEVKSPPKFSLEKLRENCMELFGVSCVVFDGAANGLNGEYTVSEMKTIIKKWNKKEAK